MSGLDAAVTLAALADTTWERACRRDLQDDGCELERLLGFVASAVVPGARAQFRLWQVESAAQLEEELKLKGIVVRLLGAAHGFDEPALRISAPRADERKRFTATLRAAAGQMTALSFR